ncbi:putative Magnesium or manganese-dependent protein phosphatase [Streptomyces viridochromogenes Tue57]|uniref:Putative Magnesium or manganese-dependent protein phosphatase n=1 Tax=Streptomyces viridochromogenes Tue57 TaxID=1160705 RepID=L8P6H3_STRVR|nr:putative Magnesium or manganese-dependent protein phosphatase [Streptomyces viridochromogenes Tue57]
MATDEAILAGERLLAVNLRPAAPTGSVAGLRDTTELRALAGAGAVTVDTWVSRPMRVADCATSSIIRN